MKVFKYIKDKFLNIILWSVVSAAFIGPGTVTTATMAGALYGYTLLWPIVFSTFACLLLQEAAARITIVSGLNLGQAIGKVYEGKSTKTLVLIMIVGAIILGSAAYEAGNVLGATAGVVMMWKNIDTRYIVAAMSVLSLIALNLPTVNTIAKFMGFIVLFMGLAFIYTAIKLNPPIMPMLEGSFIPRMPNADGAGLLVLGLIGTTIVPYDLFLGSGVLDKEQTVSEMRFGLSVAIILGGIISMAVLVAGTSINGTFSYPALIDGLTHKVGAWSVYIFGFGMFAAGFSSAITAPLASAITAKSLFEKNNPEKWKTQSLYFKLVWGVVLLVGLGFGFANVKPIPAIILAQALNGLILPFVAIFLWFVVNDPILMGDKVNGFFQNILMGIVVGVTLVLGMIKVTEELSAIWEFALKRGVSSFYVISLCAVATCTWLMYVIYKRRRSVN